MIPRRLYSILSLPLKPWKDQEAWGRFSLMDVQKCPANFSFRIASVYPTMIMSDGTWWAKIVSEWLKLSAYSSLSYPERPDYLPDCIVIEYWEGLSRRRGLHTRMTCAVFSQGRCDSSSGVLHQGRYAQWWVEYVYIYQTVNHVPFTFWGTTHSMAMLGLVFLEFLTCSTWIMITIQYHLGYRQYIKFLVQQMGLL